MSKTVAQKHPDASDVFAIWPGSGVPSGSEQWTWHEQTMHVPSSTPPNRMTRNVVMPTVTMFKPAIDLGNGTAIIVAPGGAFHFLMMDHEGYDLAHWLAQLGITAFVLKYRVQHTPENDEDMPAFLEQLTESLPHPDRTAINPPTGHGGAEQARLWGEEDGRQAIRFLRQHAAEFGINPNRIGIMGFSAGGGIAVNAVLEHDALSRPDFAAGIYPGYRIGAPVPPDAPPLFLVIADDDKAVAPISSARLYEAWHQAGKPIELHIFGNGGHGFGTRQQNLLSDSWMMLFKNWLASHGYISHLDTGQSAS
ncbi:MAG: alpha/beta hydrolase [Anaerolineae bacterium]|nr:alpha/beta hydrolase [Anaerolineae bacterium]